MQKGSDSIDPNSLRSSSLWTWRHFLTQCKNTQYTLSEVNTLKNGVSHFQKLSSNSTLTFLIQTFCLTKGILIYCWTFNWLVMLLWKRKGVPTFTRSICCLVNNVPVTMEAYTICSSAPTIHNFFKDFSYWEDNDHTVLKYIPDEDIGDCSKCLCFFVTKTGRHIRINVMLPELTTGQYPEVCNLFF